MKHLAKTVVIIGLSFVHTVFAAETSDIPDIPDYVKAAEFFGSNQEYVFYEHERSFTIAKSADGKPEVILHSWIIEKSDGSPRFYLLTTHNADGKAIDALPQGACDNRVFPGDKSPLFHFLPDSTLSHIKYGVGNIPPAIEISPEGEWTVTAFEYHRFATSDGILLTAAANEIASKIDSDGRFTISSIRPIPDDAESIASALCANAGLSSGSLRSICRRSLFRMRPYSRAVTKPFLLEISSSDSDGCEFAYAIMRNPNLSATMILSDPTLLERFASLSDDTIDNVLAAISNRDLAERLTVAIASVVL